MAKKKTKVTKANPFDVNNDGKVDHKDIVAVAKDVLGITKEDAVEEKKVSSVSASPAPVSVPVAVPPAKSAGRIATKDINLTYRRESFVPQSVLDKWKSMGLKMEWYFE